MVTHHHISLSGISPQSFLLLQGRGQEVTISPLTVAMKKGSMEAEQDLLFLCDRWLQRHGTHTS